MTKKQAEARHQGESQTNSQRDHRCEEQVTLDFLPPATLTHDNIDPLPWCLCRKEKLDLSLEAMGGVPKSTLRGLSIYLPPALLMNPSPVFRVLLQLQARVKRKI